MTLKDRIGNEYFEWMYRMVASKRYSEPFSFRKLFAYLHNTEFVYIIPLDKNRAEDGISLRRRFVVDQNCEDMLEYLDGPCSVLEMMVATAICCEERFMDDPDIGDRTAQWFWGMITTLGLGSMTDNHFDRRYVKKVVDRFLAREYEPDGTGGLFQVRNCKYDLREVEIWYQMCFYLNGILGV
jgi:hypothetical protein